MLATFYGIKTMNEIKCICNGLELLFTACWDKQVKLLWVFIWPTSGHLGVYFQLCVVWGLIPAVLRGQFLLVLGKHVCYGLNWNLIICKVSTPVLPLWPYVG